MRGQRPGKGRTRTPEYYQRQAASLQEQLRREHERAAIAEQREAPSETDVERATTPSGRAPTWRSPERARPGSPPLTA